MQKMILILLITNGFILSNANTYKSCMDRSYGKTSLMRECINTELQYQDKLLNKHYRIARKSLNTMKKKELKLVQRAWIKYRDLVCKFNYNLTGGTMDSLAADECFLRMTKRRAIELHSIYDQEEASIPEEMPSNNTENWQEKKKEKSANLCALGWNQITNAKEGCKVDILSGKKDNFSKCYREKIRDILKEQGCKNTN